MINTSRCRQKVEGWRGRKRTYQCIECYKEFQVDTLNPLPVNMRVCPNCLAHTALYTFIDKRTGKEKEVRASSAELATARAWEINPNLTFKVPQH